jgi:tRNA threonylcarbamoyl adenosine modification protein YeaZ
VSRPGNGGPILVVDTATRRAVIALGAPSGDLIAERSWVAGYRHGEELLAQVEALLAATRTPVGELGGLVVGTGPGAFTGLRVGIATVKGLAYALGIPVVGVATGGALLAAAAAHGAPDDLVLLQPAGPSDLVLTRAGGGSRIVAGGEDPGLRAGERVVAVDLDGRVEADALALGEAALGGLAAALLRAGASRLADGAPDALATLVPEYVTLPRGVRTAVPDAAVQVTGGTDAPGVADAPGVTGRTSPGATP